MRRLPASMSVALAVLLAAAAILGAPSSLFAADPAPGGGGAAWPIPPTLAEGAVTLPNGKVLPVAPPGLGQRPSVQAEMDAEHATDVYDFSPGVRPAPLAPATTAALALGSAPGLGTASRSGMAGPSAGGTATFAASLPNGLRKEVLGFLPYWMLTADELQWMRYDLVSTIAYFGVAAQSDGTLATYATGWTGWNSSAMTNVINAAHARGVRVVLTVTMMAWDGGAQQAALLGSAAARASLVNAIVAAVRDRNADGVNLDFEPVAVAQRDQYTSFVRQLKAALVAAAVGSYLTVCTMAGAATWATGYDLAGLVSAGAADELFVMGYDYSWSGSARAGGVAPMASPYILDVNDSIMDYLEIVPGSEIIWGVPYYGRTWLTQSDSLNALTVPGASASSKAYYYVGNLVLSGQYGRLWDAVGRVPWFRYYDSVAASWVEGYYDDAASLAEKWDMVNQRDLAGTGMWTLLMDGSSPDLWNLLAAKFVIPPPMESETYDPPRTLYFAPGTYVGRQFSATGAIIASLPYTLASGSNAPTSQRSTIPNQPGAWYYITAGVWAGYWIQESAGTILGPAPPPPPATFVPLTPARLLDTRIGNGLSGPFTALVPRTFQVRGRGGVPLTATAVTGNLTVTNQTAAGFVYLGPHPIANPPSSTMNFPLGETRANGVTVALSPSGSLSLTYGASSGSADLVFDVTGYFVPDGSGATFIPLNPARLLDTRVGNGLAGAFAASAPRTFQVTGRGGVPLGATAVTGNLTVTNQTAGGYAYLGPDPVATPSTSTLNFPLGDTRANEVTVALSPSGSLSLTYGASSGTTDMVFDVTGYFVPDASGARFYALTPSRLLDTRVGNGLSGAFSAGIPRTFQVSGRGAVPSTVAAVTGNLTVTNPTAPGFAYLGPEPIASPSSSTVNFRAADTQANGFTAGLGPGGTLSLTYGAGSGATTDFIFDVSGYFALP